jgi:hypothetical protein
MVFRIPDRGHVPDLLDGKAGHFLEQSFGELPEQFHWRLQTLHNLDHRRRHVGMMMDHFPLAVLLPVDIRNALIDVDRSSRKRKTALFGADFVCHVANYADELVVEAYFAPGRSLCDLIE